MESGISHQLLIATNNSGKLREFRSLLDGIQRISLVSPSDLGITLEVAEVGKTYAENAGLKARAYAQASGLTTLADDSGLEVYALDGAPGLYSARYSPKEGATDADRRAYLLKNLADKPKPWMARFRATLALVTPAGEIQFSEGNCAGEIIPGDRGSGGFGYDRIFLVEGMDKTMAELSEDEKNQVSHRASAVAAGMGMLMKLFG